MGEKEDRPGLAQTSFLVSQAKKRNGSGTAAATFLATRLLNLSRPGRTVGKPFLFRIVVLLAAQNPTVRRTCRRPNRGATPGTATKRSSKSPHMFAGYATGLRSWNGHLAPVRWK